MLYTNSGGTLNVLQGGAGTTLPMSGLTLAGSSPQLAFDLNGVANLLTPLVSLSGNLVLNGNVRVSAANPVSGTSILLQYSGTARAPDDSLPAFCPLAQALWMTR